MSHCTALMIGQHQLISKGPRAGNWTPPGVWLGPGYWADGPGYLYFLTMAPEPVLIGAVAESHTIHALGQSRVKGNKM